MTKVKTDRFETQKHEGLKTNSQIDDLKVMWRTHKPLQF